MVCVQVELMGGLVVFRDFGFVDMGSFMMFSSLEKDRFFLVSKV